MITAGSDGVIVGPRRSAKGADTGAGDIPQTLGLRLYGRLAQDWRWGAFVKERVEEQGVGEGARGFLSKKK